MRKVRVMKIIAIALGLAAGLTAQLCAGETLRLKLEPEQEFILSGSPQEVVVKIDLTALDHKMKARRTPLNLALVLDRSGSMAGAKIEKARQAAMDLVDQLGPNDFFSLVAYSDTAEVLVPAQRVEDKEALKARISRLQPSGRTALHAGVSAGAEQLRRHLSERRIHRILLLSDGLANVGPSSTAALRQLGLTLSERGISVTTFGVGDDYNEDLMAGLAEASDANYYYVKDTEKLPQIFAKELGALQAVAARQVRIEVVCPEGVRPMGFIGRPERFDGQTASLQLSQFSLAQDRFVFLRCQLQGHHPEIARVKVSYLDELNGGAECLLSAVATVRFTDDREVASNSLRAEVAAQKQLLLAALAKDQALADADAGRYQQAAQHLAQNAGELDRAYVNAPASVQAQLRTEADHLRAYANQLEQNQYSSGTRKSLQNESWQWRNSKN
jgi:Ca-activated chloride channel homolog